MTNNFNKIDLTKEENDVGENSTEVRISEKYALTISEAAKYFNIGQHVLRKLVSIPENDYTLVVGNKHLIKKGKFAEFLDSQYNL